MQAISTISITSAMLISSSVPEADHTVWSAATVYQLGAHVIRTQTHRIYERQAAGVGTTPPEADDAVWLDVGPTNRWAMLDESPSTATSASGSISVTLAPGAVVTGIVLAGVVGASVSVLVNGATVRTAAVPAILAPATCTDLEITGLSIAAGAQIGITLTGSGTVSLGALLLGVVIELGETLPGVQIGITDYSSTETNAYGITRIVRRRYSRRIQCSVRIQTSDATRVTAVLDDLRSRIVWWSADAGYAALRVMGLYKDWSVELRGPTETVYSITIEGLARDDVFAAPEAGNLMAPPVITGMAAAMAPGGVRVSWDQSSDPEWAGSEWRMGASWATGVRLFRGAANDFVWLAPVQGLQTIWGINYDSLGEESAPVSLSLTIDGSVLLVTDPIGGNMVTNSDFSLGLAGWLVSPTTAAPVAYSGTERARQPVGPLVPDGIDALVIRQSAPISGGDLAAYATAYPIDKAPVETAQRWECSTYYAAHSCWLQLILEWHDAAGVVIASTYTNGGAVGGGAALSGWQRLTLMQSAPAGAVAARLVVVKLNTVVGAAESFAWCLMPQLKRVGSGQTAASPYSSGPSGYYGDADATRGAPAGTLVGGREAVATIQSIDAAQSAASNAQTNASNAQASANSALGQLQALSSDGVLSRAEKPDIKLRWAELSDAQAGIVASSNSFGIVTERDVYTAAIAALASYLNGLVPGWSDTSTDTTIVPAVWQSTWSAAYAARQALLNKISAAAKALADQANLGVADINSDSKWSPVEKAALVVDWQELYGSMAPLVAQANTYSIVAERDAMTTAIDDLGTYLLSLSPGWSDTSQTTTIVRSVADSKWASAYAARRALEVRISDEAGKRAAWNTVTGAGKPEDGATVGAAFGVNVGGAITELSAADYVASRALHEGLAARTYSAISCSPTGTVLTGGVVRALAGGMVSVIAVGHMLVTSGNSTPNIASIALRSGGTVLAAGNTISVTGGTLRGLSIVMWAGQISGEFPIDLVAYGEGTAEAGATFQCSVFKR